MNAPERASLAVRVGTQDTFYADLVARLGSSDFPQLAALTTRSPADPALALLDAWACVADVLTFYSERIADEGYLGTATERQSLVELARLVGYRPRPGLAASGWLAYTLDPDPADPIVLVPAGSKVQSVPEPGGKPQLFETADDLAARPSWGTLTPRRRRPMLLTRRCVEHTPVAYADGLATGLAANDRLLFHFAAEGPILRVVESVTPDADDQVTAVALQATGDGNAPCGPADLGGPAFVRWDALRVKAATFGASAPLPPPPEGPIVINVAPAGDGDWPLDTTLYDVDDTDEGRRRVLPLDADYPRIVAGSWIVVESPAGDATAIRVQSVSTLGLARYGISGKVAVLVLERPWFPAPVARLTSLSTLRGYTVYAQAEPITPAAEPITTPVAGRHIDLSTRIPEMPEGRRIVVEGTPTESGPPGEVAQVLGCRAVTDPQRPGSAPYTVLDLAAPLRGSYRRATVTVWGNAVRATNGETKDEPALGSGDASQAGQRFTLRQAPLTYVATADADGDRAELTVRVGGVAWHEVPELAWAGSHEHAYQLAVDAGGVATVQFGDGRRGARLPTGSGNLAARYRVGLGRGANVGAGKLNQPLTKPLGVSTVVNPLPTSGGTDPDSDAALRGRAPLPTRALDRLVGLRDYTDFTLARAGIGKAVADRVVAGRVELVHITVGGVDDADIEPDSDVLSGLLGACRRFGDPGVPVAAAPRTRWNVVLEARVGIDADRDPVLVDAAVRDALGTTFGYDARDLAQSLYLAELQAAVQGVPGVAFVDVRRFGATQGTGRADADAVTGVPALVRARPGHTADDGVHVDPADLVVVTGGLDGFLKLHVEVAAR